MENNILIFLLCHNIFQHNYVWLVKKMWGAHPKKISSILSHEKIGVHVDKLLTVVIVNLSL